MWHCDHCGAKWIDSTHECVEMCRYWATHAKTGQERAKWAALVAEYESGIRRGFG